MKSGQYLNKQLVLAMAWAEISPQAHLPQHLDPSCETFGSRYHRANVRTGGFGGYCPALLFYQPHNPTQMAPNRAATTTAPPPS